jgi:hypothetical protein
MSPSHLRTECVKKKKSLICIQICFQINYDNLRRKVGICYNFYLENLKRPDRLGDLFVDGMKTYSMWFQLDQERVKLRAF